MLKKTISEQEIIQLLKLYYGIDVQAMQLLTDGADMNALAYRIDTKINSYFVKFKQDDYNEINLSLLHLLHDSGINEIILPTRTLVGELFQPLDNLKIIIYPFIDAPNGFSKCLTEKQWNQLGKVLKNIHETVIPNGIQKQLRRETYSTKWREIVKSFYKKLEPVVSDDQITTEFKVFFKNNINIIHRLVDSADELSKKIHPALDKYVLCHSDIHAGNVLVANESIYIIDWDEPMLAPKERDLMFIGGGVGNVWNLPSEMAYFYEGYGETDIDKKILAYYRYERIIEDMAVYAQDIFSANENSKLMSFKYFKSMFEPNDVIDVAFNTAI